MKIPRVDSWPKLIGMFTVAIGIAASLKAAEVVFEIEMEYSKDSLERYAWPAALACAGFIATNVIGYGAYSAREWSRRALLGITAVAIALGCGLAYLRVTISINSLEPYLEIWWRLLSVGEALRFVAPPIFFLLVLRHPDVVRSFQPPDKPTILPGDAAAGS